GALRVQCRQATRPQPGDEVDVLGFADRGDYSPVLEDAEFKVRAKGISPEPVPLKNFQAALDRDSDLVSIEAMLAAQHFSGVEWTLLLQTGKETFRASLTLPPET